MKVLHIGLTSHYTDKMLYQDNILPDINVKAGHDVTFITDIFEYKNGDLTKTDECDLVLDNGVRLIRLSYDRIINDFITNKIQKCKKIARLLDDIQPDTILYHGVCGYELMDVAAYVRKHDIPFYIDSHENFKNTAMTMVSRFAYKYIHGYFIKKSIPYAKKILYIGYPEKEYLQELYHISDDRLEYFPLGGIILNESKQNEYRKKMINEMGFPTDAIICAHSGKMSKGKKTEDILRAFLKVTDERLRLIIFGSIPEEMKTVLEPLIEADGRVLFIGWKDAKEQEGILGATDLYIQPGTYSATAQIALCDGCALIVNDGYKDAMGEAPFYEDNAMGIERILKEITDDLQVLTDAKAKCYDLAIRQFDYKKMAERYLL